MKSKLLHSLILFAGIIIYTFSFIATSKPYPSDPCQVTLQYWFQKDTTRKYSYLQFTYNDSVLVFADTLHPINWTATTDTICTIFKDSCNKTTASILVINRRDTIKSGWDTRYGKKILFKKCP